MKDKALVYIHGKGGTASATEQFKPIFPDYDTYGFDYKSETPWEAESEYKEYFLKLAEKYSSITVLASSLGAYFLMVSGTGVMIQKALFVSPIVDMESTGSIQTNKQNSGKSGLKNICNITLLKMFNHALNAKCQYICDNYS